MQSNACQNSLRALLFLSFLIYSIFHQDLHSCQDTFFAQISFAKNLYTIGTKYIEK